MIRYYLKFAFRNFRKHKLFSFINIMGLSVGIVACILAFLYIQDELKYDKHFTNTDNVYSVFANNFLGDDIGQGQPLRFLPEILKDIPEVTSGMRICTDELNFRIKEKHYSIENIYSVDSNFFSFFGWELIQGNANSVLNNKFDLVISESMAKKYFGDENPVGEVILVEGEHKAVVTGVFKNIPKHSHLKTDCILSLESWRNMNFRRFDTWGNFSSVLYLSLNSNADPVQVSNKIKSTWLKHSKDGGYNEDDVNFYLEPYKEIYLFASKYGKEAGYSSINRLKGFIVLALIILIIASFNFINLSSALLSKRLVEAGVKKTVGANSGILGRQIITETAFFVFLSLMLAFAVTYLILPHYNSYADKELVLSFSQNPLLIYFSAGIFIAIVLGTSIVPSLSFTSIKPVGIFRSKNQGDKRKSGGVWNVLVVSQFVLGITLIISALLVNKQLEFIRTENLGFNRENILVVDNEWDRGSTKRYELFKEATSQFPEIKKISCATNVPSAGIWNWGMPQLVEDLSKGIPNCGYVSVDNNFFDILDAKIIEGRMFDKEKNSDKFKVILSKTALKILGEEEPIGKTVKNTWDGKDREIIGIVDDINYGTIHTPIDPVIFYYDHTHIEKAVHIIARIQSTDLQKTIKNMQTAWESQNPTRPFNYFFIDDKFNAAYEQEIKTSQMMNALTVIAIFLSCLGLFGLALFIINNKIKEIGIRKVNGASVTEVVTQINGRFVRWVLISYILSCPISFFIMQRWMMNFAYRVELQAGIFVFGGLITIAVALLTVSIHSIRMSKRNPVEALRYE